MDDVFTSNTWTTVANNAPTPAIGNGSSGHRPMQIARDESSRVFVWVQFGVAGVLSGDPLYLLGQLVGSSVVYYVTNIYSAVYATTAFLGIAAWDPNHAAPGGGAGSAPGRTPLQYDWGWCQTQGANVVPMTASGAITANHNFTPTATSQIGDGGTGVSITGQVPLGISAAGALGAGTVFLHSGIS